MDLCLCGHAKKGFGDRIKRCMALFPDNTSKFEENRAPKQLAVFKHPEPRKNHAHGTPR